MYKLPDGQTLNLGEVESVSRIRDLGQDKNTIGYSRIGFKVYMRNGSSVEVAESYHFADWAEVKKKLNHIRNEIVAHVHELNGDK